MSVSNNDVQHREIKVILVGVIGFLLVGILLLAIGYFALIQMRQLGSISMDRELRQVLATHEITPLDLGPTPAPEKVALGQALFFDKELSGNRDISCATCHHPDLAGADSRSLPIGTGGSGLGEDRLLGVNRSLIPRHAPEIFNRGSAEWRTMFWDGRIAVTTYFESPAGDVLPEGLDSALAAQAMFPPTSRDEMRGLEVDQDVRGKLNEVGAITESDPSLVWAVLTDRLMDIPEYREMFATAYPELDSAEIGFQHAANAIAAFEIDAFSFDDSPWDLYVAGDNDALTPEQKAGARLFYGSAGCSQCHSGNLMTDQEFHNIGVPQLGPGKENPDGLDFGRYLETGNAEDYFAFRTPPLANVAITPPYMHNGAYLELEDAVRHHLNVQAGLRGYDVTQLDPLTAATYQADHDVQGQLLNTLDPLVAQPNELDDAQMAQLMAFLDALTAPSAINLEHLVPDRVPSGLPIAD